MIAAVFASGSATVPPLAALIDNLSAGRAQMGTSLAFHIIFAAIGVGLPVMMVIAEGVGIRTGDRQWLALARKWSKAAGVLFVVGAVSGTVISFELGLLWPEFMRYAGGIIGFPFSLEGVFFFTEAIFLAIYIYGWDRLTPKLHWLSGIGVAIAGLFASIMIMSANSWMNTPAGFNIEAAKNGVIEDVDPLAAMLNQSWATHGPHLLIACLMATAFGVAAVYAVGMLRGRRDGYHRKALTLALAMGAILAPIQLGVGDLVGRTTAQTQPAKLAAMEGIWNTEEGAGLGLLDFPIKSKDESVLIVDIPYLLSLLAYDDPHATVRGYGSFPEDERTDYPLLVRLSFLGMVGIGTGLIVLAIWFWLYRRIRGKIPEDKWTLRAIAVAGPLTFLAIELGWIVTEVGRQPWIIQGVLRTADAITPQSGLDIVFTAFLLIYIVLAALTIWLLRKLSSGDPGELDERGKPIQEDQVTT